MNTVRDGQLEIIPGPSTHVSNMKSQRKNYKTHEQKHQETRNEPWKHKDSQSNQR